MWVFHASRLLVPIAKLLWLITGIYGTILNLSVKIIDDINDHHAFIIIQSVVHKIYIPNRTKQRSIYPCRKWFLSFVSQIQIHQFVDPVNPFVIPSKSQISQMVVHLPKSPCLVLGCKQRQLLPNLVVFIIRLPFVVKYRTVYDKKFTRIPSAYSMLCFGINNQFPLLRRC